MNPVRNSNSGKNKNMRQEPDISNGMNRRDFLKKCAAVGAGGFVLSNRALEVSIGARRPNFIFFLADDMGWMDATYNGGDIPTPNLDLLAREGAVLDQFYVQPVCTPTRGCLMTGRYPFKTDTLVRYAATHAGGMMIDERTLADALRQAGYWTVMLGKWHLGQWESEYLPVARGFDHHYGHYSALIDYFTHYRDEVLDWHRNGRPVIEDGYSTYLLADEFERLLDGYDGSKPFFFYIPFNAVHGPKQAPQEVVDKYIQLGHSDPKLAACVECMDIAIGRMVKAVQQHGLRDNTLVAFCSDNGGTKSRGNGQLKGWKSAYHEGGIRVLALMSWPGKIKAGTVVTEPLHIVDIYPTFVKLAGGSLQQPLPLDGIDAWATIAKAAPTPHDEIVHGPETIRKGDWKLIQGHAEYYNWKAEVTQLYNIAQDPYEQNNLVDQHPEIVAELDARLAYHATQARTPPERQKIPNFPVPVYGEDEQDMI